jgi:hypothetical protein
MKSFLTGVGINMAIQKSAITFSSQWISGRSMMKTSDNVPERADAIGTWLDKLVAACLIEPTCDHAIRARDHVCVIDPGCAVSRIKKCAFFSERKSFR